MQSDQKDDWSQLWATFSVKDHVRPETFIAEVLLYDKLVIPILPTREHGLSGKDADDELKRWKKERWDPRRQAQVLRILNSGPDKEKWRAEAIPWTADRGKEWETEMKSGFAGARKNGWFETGTVLERFVPAMARSVVAVSQYRSLDDLQQSEHVRRRLEPEPLLPGSALLSVLGFELLVPESLDPKDLGPLRDAVEVSRDPGYRDARRALFEWQRKFIRDGLTDAPSIRAAVDEMNELVAQQKKATHSEKRWRGVKKFFSFIGVSSEVAALAGPPAAVAAGVGSAFAAVGGFVVDNVSPGAAKIPAATLIADAQERLGIE